MTTLNRLKAMSDKEIQNWLRKVGQENAAPLAVALAGADNTVKDCVFRNMSHHARALLIKDIEECAKKGVPVSEIERNAEIIENML